MKNYLVLMRGGTDGYAALDEAGQKALYEKWGAYVGRLTESGNWVKGNPLDHSGRLMCEKRSPQEGTMGDGDSVVAGFMILEAEGYDEAVALAKDCPSLDVGAKVEIREAVEM